MQDRNCEILFEYLKSILFDVDIQTLDIEKLDESHQKLGRGLILLGEMLEEMRHYTEELSKGNISVDYPSKDNFLCGNLKNLHANLNHLTWQAQQVAAGDYSQHISYLGEFSNSFNIMIEQLQEREEYLKRAAEEEKQRLKSVESRNELLLELSRKSNEWIKVTDAQTGKLLYCNHRDVENEMDKEDTGFCDKCPQRIDIKENFNWKSGDCSRIHETESSDGRFFRVTYLALKWKGQDAHVRIIRDVTAEKQTTDQLTDKAYHDPLTGIGNRLYFEEFMEKILWKGKTFTLCYMDLDHLKEVNDRYGHLEGDVYIQNFTAIVRDSIRDDDLFARLGGDEFCVVLVNCRKEMGIEKMKRILNKFHEENKKPYPVSFSYGVVEHSEQTGDLSMENILMHADEIMYRRKRAKKEART